MPDQDDLIISVRREVEAKLQAKARWKAEQQRQAVSAAEAERERHEAELRRYADARHELDKLVELFLRAMGRAGSPGLETFKTWKAKPIRWWGSWSDRYHDDGPPMQAWVLLQPRPGGRAAYPVDGEVVHAGVLLTAPPDCSLLWFWHSQPIDRKADVAPPDLLEDHKDEIRQTLVDLMVEHDVTP